MKQAISKEKVAAALKQEELGVPVEDIIREMGVSRETYLGWRRNYGGITRNAAPPDVEQAPDQNIQNIRKPDDA